MVALFAGLWPAQEPKNIAGPALNLSTDNISNADPLAPSGEPHKTPSPWVVYVTGAVRYPGVYKVHEGARVYELVEKAGGLSEEADGEAFNMAAPMFDGAHLHVPRKGEKASDGLVVPRGGDSGVLAEEVSQTESHKGEKVDINRATADELESLPGIGAKTAEAIIQYRNSNGPFKCVEDLLSVKGIGPKKLEKIREHVTIKY